MEIQGAKEDGYLTGLSYPDTLREIAPIVDKLLYGLQDKWVTPGSLYKEKITVAFLLLSISVTLCAVKKISEMNLASCI